MLYSPTVPMYDENLDLCWEYTLPLYALKHAKRYEKLNRAGYMPSQFTPGDDQAANPDDDAWEGFYYGYEVDFGYLGEGVMHGVAALDGYGYPCAWVFYMRVDGTYRLFEHDAVWNPDQYIASNDTDNGMIVPEDYCEDSETPYAWIREMAEELLG